MTLTTQSIIEMLPFNPEFKKQLLEKLDTFTSDQKFEIEQLVWDAYADLYEIKLEENTQLAMQRVADKQETFDADFAKRIQEKTEQDMVNQTVQETTAADLSETREELEKILRQQTQ